MKPDTSFVLKSGHFHLLTTLTDWRRSNQNLNRPLSGSMSALPCYRQLNSFQRVQSHESDSSTIHSALAALSNTIFAPLPLTFDLREAYLWVECRLRKKTTPSVCCKAPSIF